VTPIFTAILVNNKQQQPLRRPYRLGICFVTAPSGKHEVYVDVSLMIVVRLASLFIVLPAVRS